MRHRHGGRLPIDKLRSFCACGKNAAFHHTPGNEILFMEKIIINGGRPLYGSVEVSGSKNAAVPIILATLMIDDKCIEMILKKNCQSAIVPTLDPVVANHRLPAPVRQ